jgi:hypothetical protein
MENFRTPEPPTQPVPAAPEPSPELLVSGNEPRQIPVLVYDIMSGRITHVMQLPSHTVEMYLEMNFPILFNQVGDPDSQYVVHGDLEDRPENPAYVDGMTIKNIPVDAAEPVVVSVTASRATQSVTMPYGDAELELELLPGGYVVEIVAFPYKTVRLEVNA